jgi:hypothetical protein
LSITRETPPPVEERIAAAWVGPGCLSLQILAEDAAAEASLRDLPDFYSSIRSAAQKARESSAAKKATRLEADLARARASQGACREKTAQATAAARAALEAGEDATAHESAIRELRVEAELLGQRIEVLAPLLAASQAQAAATVRAAGQAAWRDAVQEITERRQALLGRLHAALAPLANELYALDAVARQLFDPRTGGLPERLLQDTAALNGHVDS